MYRQADKSRKLKCYPGNHTMKTVKRNCFFRETHPSSVIDLPQSNYEENYEIFIWYQMFYLINNLSYIISLINYQTRNYACKCWSPSTHWRRAQTECLPPSNQSSAKITFISIFYPGWFLIYLSSFVKPRDRALVSNSWPFVCLLSRITSIFHFT